MCIYTYTTTIGSSQIGEEKQPSPRCIVRDGYLTIEGSGKETQTYYRNTGMVKEREKGTGANVNEKMILLRTHPPCHDTADAGDAVL